MFNVRKFRNSRIITSRKNIGVIDPVEGNEITQVIDLDAGLIKNLKGIPAIKNKPNSLEGIVKIKGEDFAVFPLTGEDFDLFPLGDDFAPFPLAKGDFVLLPLILKNSTPDEEEVDIRFASFEHLPTELVSKVLSGIVQQADDSPNSLKVIVEGSVGSPGWSSPMLVPYSYILPPSDGFQEFSFLAQPPSSDVIQVVTSISAQTLWNHQEWIKGFRIFDSNGSIEFMAPPYSSNPSMRVDV